MDWLPAALLSLVAYLLGSIPSAYILVYLVKHVDIRQVGSRNVGALNTFQQVGPWGGVVVLLADTGKGALVVLLPHWLGAPDWMVYPAAVLVVVGHNWPVFLRFHGGKGAASILGIALALAPILTLISMAPVALIILLARNVVIGVAAGFILFNTLTVVTHQGVGLITLCLALTFLVIGTYLQGTFSKMLAAVKAHRWREVFYEGSLNPEE